MTPNNSERKQDFKPKPVSLVIHLTIGHLELIMYVVILPSEVLEWDPNRMQVKFQDSQETVSLCCGKSAPCGKGHPEQEKAMNAAAKVLCFSFGQSVY